MTSQINYADIDELYPVAGQDNDSQGFRDNFEVIKTALTFASSEITELQTKSILTAGLTDNEVVNNDLNGSTINNGKYANFNPLFQSETVSVSTFTVVVSEFPVRSLLLTDIVTLRFSGWTTDAGAESCNKVQLHLSSSTNPFQVSFSQPAGTIKYSDDFPNPLIVDSSTAGTVDVVEAWSYNGGNIVFLKYIGKYNATPPTVQTIKGGLSVTGNTTLGDSTADTVTITGIPKFPVLTTSNRNGLTAVAGMVIFNSTTVKLQVCTIGGDPGNATWVDLH